MIRPLRAMLIRLAALTGRDRQDRELAAELESHLQMHIDDNLRAGMSPAEARRHALLKLGGVAVVSEAYRDRRGIPFLEHLAQDVAYALRAFRRNAGFTTAAGLTLALGIGATTAMFSIADGVLFHPLPLPDAAGLVRLREANPGLGLGSFSVSIPNYQSWRREARSLELAAYISVARNWTGAGEPRRLEAIAGSSTLAAVLATPMQTGRWFTAEEEIPGQHQAVVLSDGFWRREFAADPHVVGRKMELEGESYLVVGVARADMGIPAPPDIWVPLLAQPREGDPNTNRANRFLQVAGRLRPGYMLGQARAEMAALATRIEAEFPKTNQGWTAVVFPLGDSLVPVDTRTAVLLLLAAVGMVLLIGCANVANLQLARAEARRKEMSIRVALGAGAGRIARQLLTENLLLSLGGGAAGVGLAWGIVVLARRYLVDLVPRAEALALDMRVLAFAFGISVLTGLLFGAAPMAPLRRSRTLLVVAQVSLAAMLLSGAALLIQSLAHLQAVQTGMDPRGVMTARLPLPSGQYAPGGAYAQLLARLTAAIGSAPGVRAAGVSSAIPLGPGAHMMCRAAAVGEGVGEPLNCSWRPADAGFFAALRIPLLRGRLFAREERPVYLLSQEAARTLFGDADPVGRQVRMNDVAGEVIGVVGDVAMRSPANPPERAIYVPLAQGGFFGVFSIFVRTEGAPERAVALIKDRLRELDPQLPAYSFRSMYEWVEASSAGAGLRTWVLALLALVAVLLGAVGIYGVLAYVVMLRRKEFGVRLALGASPGRLLALVMREGLAMGLFGIGAGLGAGMLLADLLDSLLFGVNARDPLTFAGVAVVLAAVCAAACYGPARRAARADPVAALRAE